MENEGAGKIAVEKVTGPGKNIRYLEQKGGGRLVQGREDIMKIRLQSAGKRKNITSENQM